MQTQKAASICFSYSTGTVLVSVVKGRPAVPLQHSHTETICSPYHSLTCPVSSTVERHNQPLITCQRSSLSPDIVCLSSTYPGHNFSVKHVSFWAGLSRFLFSAWVLSVHRGQVKGLTPHCNKTPAHQSRNRPFYMPQKNNMLWTSD